jgi:signal peptidase I
MSEDQKPQDADAAKTDATDPTPEEVFAASEADAPVEAVKSDSTEKRPIWSDAGDAPFEDAAKTPVYARKPAKTAKAEPTAGDETMEIVKTIFFALLIAMVLRIFLFQPFTIPSASMEPNLYEGDYIVVSKWSYGYSKHSIPFSPPLFDGRVMGSAPKRGDIVVFKLPRDDKTDFIKRVIGLPGDRIQMISNKLYINDRPVEDVVVSEREINDIFGAHPVAQVRETLPEGKRFMTQDFGPGNDLDDTPVYEVPVGHYFMMGDNRDNSIDSRVEQSSGVGMVPAENLVGKAQIILFSWEPGASLFKPWTWANVRLGRFFNVLH